MPETPKEKPPKDNSEGDRSKHATWAEDQKKREYYYDDAHGYEVFVPENETKDESDPDVFIKPPDVG